MTESPSENAALGLLGGTFDPIHLGHLRLAEEAREALGLSGICFVPAGVPPHRGAPASSPEHRLAMVRLALAGNPFFSCEDSEVFAEGKSYTVLTLERLRARFGPSRPLILILGADAFQGLPAWHRWESLLDLAHVAVANRPGFTPQRSCWPGTLSPELDRVCRDRSARTADALHASACGSIVPFDMTPLAISASHIRDVIRTGSSARYLLPDSVLDYIARHSLYL